MQTIGERLEEARKKKGISIREAAEATKIRGDYLQKFESNHFDIGLTEIYTRGFLRTYANFLKVPSDRLLNDYAALGRGDTRPRIANREVYGRMDISVSSAGDAKERPTPPPQEESAAPENSRPQPRYPRGSTSLPSGPDPALVFKYLKWAGGIVVLLLLIWLGTSFFSSKTDGQIRSAPTAAPARVVTNSVTITALGAVRTIRIDEKIPNVRPEDSYGAAIVSERSLAKGESMSFTRTGPVYLTASALENIQIDIPGQAPILLREQKTQGRPDGFKGPGSVTVP